MLSDGVYEQGEGSLPFSFSGITDDVFSFSEIGIDEITELLRCILLETHSHPQKKTLDNYHNRLNFACPYCGDSTSNPSKKRGNIYLDSMSFKCFNCGIFKSGYDFFHDFSGICKIGNGEMSYLLAVKRGAEEFTRSSQNTVYENVVLNRPRLIEHAIPRESIKKKYGFMEVNDTPARNYLHNRGQFDDWRFLYDPKFKRIAILNSTPDGSKILGYQTRTIGSGQKSVLTKSFEAMRFDFGFAVNDDFEKLNDLSSIFRIMELDLNYDITVTEGPMDAFLIRNAVALSGAFKKLPFDTVLVRFMFDMDTTGYDKAIESINNGYPVFLWDKYLRDHGIPKPVKKLDYNDLILYAKSKNIKLKPIGGYFSRDRLDGIYI